MTDEKAMTLRMSNWTHLQLKAISNSEGKTVSTVVREAIEAHIERRKAAPEFQKRIRARISENNDLLKGLLTDER